MLEEKMKFTESKIKTYNRKKKILEGTLMVTGILMLLSFVIAFYLLRNSDYWIVNIVNIVVKHVSTNLIEGTILGAVYTSTLGGLFFVLMPNELLFMNTIQNNPWISITIISLVGFTISYTINYYAGQKLSGIAKKIITPKKFYKTKGIINKWGKWAILGFNALPLPSQPLAAILGVFNYNKTRFYVFFLTGQLIKAIYLTIITLYL